MYYYLIPIAILFVAAISGDAGTWSPFQSKQARDICRNMTKSERHAAVKRGALWGALLGIIPGVLGLILGIAVFRSALTGVLACLIVIPVAVLVLHKKWLPLVIKSQQQFLASTQWAKSQGIKADDIKLYSWQQ